MTQPLTSAHRLVLLTVALGVTAVCMAYYFSGRLALLTAGLLCVLLWLLRPLLMPPGYGAMRIRTLSILGVFGLAASYGFWSQLVDAAVGALARNPQVLAWAPWIRDIDLGGAPSISVLVFAGFGVFIVNRYLADTSISGGHPIPVQLDFPEENFDRKLEAFCSALNQHLLVTDHQTNWSPEYYADLEAEVEIVSLGASTDKRRILDLQSAIRSDRTTRAFLVLGDPGAGKSVALRKLARDMLSEAGNTGRVPIYINLREWLPKEGRRKGTWTERSPPTIHELEAFIAENVKSRGDVFTEEFVDKYFRDLWRHGRLFFILDSFDEIPELLDVSEESWLINALSDVLSRLIITHPRSRGVLASRVFRRPTPLFAAQKTLDIRPLTEDKIVDALARFPAFTLELRTALFKDRVDLIPIARNPFLMTLLGEWVNAYRALPNTQAQLYESYLNGRLAKCAAKIREYRLNERAVLRGATDIAWFVFQSPDYGLEAPVRVIDEQSSNPDTAAIVEILSHARIGRVTQTEPKSFAFVHRRFLEYLVTTRLLNQPESLPLEHIPTDSRGRDALVLYAQVCEPLAAHRLAELCWCEIQHHFTNSETRLRAIHCLRFLSDAFRARRDAVAPFEQALADLIRSHVVEGDSLVHAKICLETTGLLSEATALPILQSAMSSENAWLRETAFRACRHLPRLDRELEEAIRRYVRTMPLAVFWSGRRSLLFSLSLSDALKAAHREATFRCRNVWVSVVAAMLACVGFFEVTGAVLTVYVLEALAFTQLARTLPMLRLREVSLRLPWTPNRARTHASKTHRFHFLSFDTARYVMGFMLVGAASVSLSSDFTLGLVASWVFPRDLERQILLGLIGVFIVDWVLVRDGLTSLWRFLRTPRQAIVLIAGVVATSICVIAGVALVVWLERWMQDHGMLWLRDGLFASFGVVFVGFLLWRAVWDSYGYLRDRQVSMNLTLPDRMPRSEVVRVLASLTTLHWKRSFLARLAQHKVKATGSWPPGFEMSVSGDPVLTELAKLEERWLGLDR